MSGITRRAHALCFLLLVVAPGQQALCQRDIGRRVDAVAFTQSVLFPGTKLQVDFAGGALNVSRNQIAQRIRLAAIAVARYYGRFPVPRVRLLIIPVAGAHGVLQGTTWGDRSGFPAYVRVRIGQTTTPEELASDWVITHEFIHTALPSLPADQEWLEEGLASYVEPIARVQAGQLPAEGIWADMMSGMPHGEPASGDRGLDVTHTWGRTYWGGSLFCLMADIEIRKETKNRKGLQDALRALVSGGGSIDQNWPLERILTTGDRATGTHVLEKMYAKWSTTPVSVDLTELWKQLGVRKGSEGVSFDPSAPLANIRKAMTSVIPMDVSLR
ncbi:hypothetical protein [Granulicella sibirica]|uniref:Peptidase MA-like domain-containing protein n=1 Tax=Granulicella sibirica TaxID=2479048 RepID=A0A4Q0SW38_9BACT|nr:hypothetical protein [Granulicella sibirica]RXH54120.1 hypothetical protein GRAN_4771 [Granulicella sibirica]